MATDRYQELFTTAFRELHDEGNDWMYLPDVAQRAASHDEEYMRRRQKINRTLGFIGIRRSELPDGHFYPPRAGLYPLIVRMEQSGLVEGQFEEQPNPDKPRRRMYRLIESEQSE
jgi:hypothetical protein